MSASFTAVDILVDGPLLGILPQRITVDLNSIIGAATEDPTGGSWVRVLLAQVEPALVDGDGREVLLPADATTVLISEPLSGGEFTVLSTPEKLIHLARLRVAPDTTAATAASGAARGKAGAPDLSAVFSMLGNESTAFDPNAPDIGSLAITIVRCDGLFNVDTLKTSSPYVVAYGQGRKEVFRTDVVASDLNPVFAIDNESATFILPINSFSGHARLRVMSRQYMDAFMGEAIVEVIELVSSAGDELTFELQPRRDEQDPDIAGAQSLGTITIRCVGNFPADGEVAASQEEEEANNDEAGGVEQDEDVTTPPNEQDPPLFHSPISPDMKPAPPALSIATTTNNSSTVSNNNKVLGEVETTSVMLDVVKLVVADAVASIPLAVVSEYELSLRKLDVMRGGVMEDRGWSSRDVPDDTVSHAFFRAMLDGYQIGIGHSRRAAITVLAKNPSPHQQVSDDHVDDRDEEIHELRNNVVELTAEVDALQKRLNHCLNALETTRDDLAASQQHAERLSAVDLMSGLQSPNSMQGNRAPPCTPATQHSSNAAQQQQLTPTQLPLSVVTATTPPPKHQRHLDAAAHQEDQQGEIDIEISPPAADNNNNVPGDIAANAVANENAASSQGDSGDPTTTTTASIDAMVDFTMVVCFYNAFDYVTKTTRKKGRAVSLSSSKGETRFQMLERTVAATFREGLSVSYLDVDGKRHVIVNDAQLTSLLLKLKASGYRPVFQCFDPEEEIEASVRVDIGSSPKKMFAMRSPAPPEAPSTALANLVPSPSRPSTRPSSASTSHLGSRTVSAMSVRSSATSMPFDYIAGSALDDDTIAHEFEIVSGGGESVSKEDVLAYLEARYDSIGDAGRFKRLLDSLFRRKTRLGANEFAIVLLRLSQS